MAKTPKKPITPAKKTPKVREDIATTAFRVMMEATGQAPKTPDPDAGKDPAAVARGKKGGSVGGKSRAAKLAPKRRRQIAKKAADARWGSS